MPAAQSPSAQNETGASPHLSHSSSLQSERSARLPAHERFGSLPGHLAATTAMNAVERLRSLPAFAAHRRRVPLRAATALDRSEALRAVFHVRRFVHLLVAHFPSPAVNIRCDPLGPCLDPNRQLDVEPCADLPPRAVGLRPHAAWIKRSAYQARQRGGQLSRNSREGKELRAERFFGRTYPIPERSHQKSEKDRRRSTQVVMPK